MKIYRANLIHTPSPEAFQIIPNGYIGVRKDGTIEFVGETLPAQYHDAEVVDYGDRLLLPAFNDMHLHAPQYRNVGIAMDEELLPWLEKYTFPEESKFRDTVYAERIYRRFVHELWMQGTMRSCVFATIHGAATNLLADLYTQAGLSAKVGLVGMNRNCPSTLSNTTEEMTRDTVSLMKHLEGNPLVQPILTPRFIPSCTPDMLTRYGELAQQHQLPVQSHLSENRNEIAWVHELEPDTTCYGSAYNKYGLFGQTPTLMAHCCYSSEEELELMRHNQVMIVHCPTSNFNIASGMAPIREYLNRGIKVALGTDIGAGHYMSMLRIIQYAVQSSKLHQAQTNGESRMLSLSEAFYLATKSGGSFFGKVGSFEPGYAFDALVIDDTYLNHDHYSLSQRLERIIYIGDDRDIRVRFCQGKELPEPEM